MNQTYGIELPFMDGKGNELSETYFTFADQVLESIFGEFQQLDAVGLSDIRQERLELLNKILAPYGYSVVSNGKPATAPLRPRRSCVSSCAVPYGVEHPTLSQRSHKDELSLNQST